MKGENEIVLCAKAMYTACHTDLLYFLSNIQIHTRAHIRKYTYFFSRNALIQTYSGTQLVYLQTHTLKDLQTLKQKPFDAINAKIA